MKIGIFGGCFNPPHETHLEIAKNLLNSKILDKVIFIPTGDNYEKKDLTLLHHRLEMLNLMTNGFPNIIVSSLMQDNSYKYTYQTLDYYQKQYPNSSIYFICGSDNLKELDTWKKYTYILKNYELLVLRRNNDDLESILKKYNNYKNKIQFINLPESAVSSTKIRENVEVNKKFLDPSVYKYIKENNLYDNY